jgi:hypothetical protein
MSSPYENVPPDKWLAITRRLVRKHPLLAEELIDVVHTAWQSIFDSRMGSKGFRIGIDILPKPQIMGFFLHELIPLELAARHPERWRVDRRAGEKDAVYLPNNAYSIEIKTSSNPTRIFGNRSYAQPSQSSKKSKSGYCLAVNFEKFSDATDRPRIVRIRFGWLDAADWVGQTAATGQQARLSGHVEASKLIRLYPAS